MGLALRFLSSMLLSFLPSFPSARVLLKATPASLPPLAIPSGSFLAVLLLPRRRCWRRLDWLRYAEERMPAARAKGERGAETEEEERRRER